MINSTTSRDERAQPINLQAIHNRQTKTAQASSRRERNLESERQRNVFSHEGARARQNQADSRRDFFNKMGPYAPKKFSGRLYAGSNHSVVSHANSGNRY